MLTNPFFPPTAVRITQGSTYVVHRHTRGKCNLQITNKEKRQKDSRQKQVLLRGTERRVSEVHVAEK